MLQNKIKILLIILLPLCIAALYICIMFTPPFDFLDHKKSDVFTILPYSDMDTGGNTDISLCEDSSHISYSYTTGTIKEFPYAGIMLFNNDSSFTDISKFSHIQVTIRTSQGKKIPLYLNSYFDGFSELGNYRTYFTSLFYLDTHNEWNTLQIPLQDFSAPDWWYRNINKTKEELPSPDLSKLAILNFANCHVLRQEETDIVEISSIIFYRDMSPHYTLSLLFICLFYTFIFIYTYLRERKQTKKTTPLFTYEKIEIENPIDKELKKIFEYITKHYHNSELSIIDVEKNCGISERRISQLIKKETNLHFKQFLNTLRIVEAKRLLTETDLHISEIAFNVGYGNISHFNRVFKSITHESPSDFRKQHNSL